MKLPRVRFTVRRLMVAVVIVGLMLGLGAWMARRSAEFRKRAESHMRTVRVMYSIGRWKPRGFDRNAWAWRMGEKYAYAASHPWLPVEPDPPEPTEPK
jgi:hypothetical protein